APQAVPHGTGASLCPLVHVRRHRPGLVPVMNFSLPSALVPIFPAIALALGAAAVLLLVSIFKKSGSEAGYLAFGCIVFSSIPLMKLIQDNVTVTLFSGALIIDRFALLFWLLFLAIAGLTVLSSIPVVEKDGHGLGEYHVLIMCATLGMMMMAASENLLTLF